MGLNHKGEEGKWDLTTKEQKAKGTKLLRNRRQMGLNHKQKANGTKLQRNRRQMGLNYKETEGKWD